MGVTSIASANPIMAVALIFITAYVVFIKKNEIKSGHVAKGAIISSVSVAIFSILGLPLLVELGIAIIVTTLVRKKVLENEELMNMVATQIQEIKQSSLNQYNTVTSSLTNSFTEITHSKYMDQLSKINYQSFKKITTGRYLSPATDSITQIDGICIEE